MWKGIGRSSPARAQMDAEASANLEFRQQIEAVGRSQAVIEFDLDGTVRTANANFLATLGYELADIEGKHHSMFVPPEERSSEAYRRFWENLRSGRHDSGEYRRIHKDGSDVYIRATYTPILGPDGKPYKVVKFATDVTAERREQAERQGQIEAIGRSQAIISFDLDGTILDANENFLNAMGYRLDEIKGRHHRIFVDQTYAASADYAAFWDTLRRGEFLAAQYTRYAKGGREVVIQASYNPIMDAAGRPVKVVKFATDVTAQVVAAREEAERTAKANAEQTEAITGLSHGLKELREGHLDVSLTTPFAPAYEPLREDFNQAVETLGSLVSEVISGIGIVDQGTSEVTVAADDLARRTAQQAATLEEIAAAVAEITGAVSQTASHSEEANRLVGDTRERAEASGIVVADASRAMTTIEQSSSQVTTIIGVIDEIAFQTNLLALNAGVEAARAGDAGRGFAVVATEVRALAQRSSQAAKEIKTLIQQSRDQVGEGVELVGKAGEASSAIAERVISVSQLVAEISEAAKNQARGLGETNQSVSQLDLVTQQNSAMVEQTNAACESMRSQVQGVRRLLSSFRVKGDAATGAAQRPAIRAVG